MMSSSPLSSTQAERILSYWHKVELFESAELKDIDHGKGAIHYRSDELLEAPNCRNRSNNLSITHKSVMRLDSQHGTLRRGQLTE